MTEAAILQEVNELVEAGVLRLVGNDPQRPVVTVVGNQRSDREDDVYEFVSAAARKYPHMRLIVGDTSNLEKAAALAAEHQDIEWDVVKKADKGEWDEGATIRDERVVALSTQIVAFDTSKRSKDYQKLAKRMNVPFHTV